MRTTSREDKDFEVLVKERIDLGDATWVIEWVYDNFQPEDIFGRDTLETWALDNGFVEGESTKE